MINVLHFPAFYKILNCSKQNFSAILYSSFSSAELTTFLEFACENVVWGCVKSYNKTKLVYSFNCSFFKETFSILLHNENLQCSIAGAHLKLNTQKGDRQRFYSYPNQTHKVYYVTVLPIVSTSYRTCNTSAQSLCFLQCLWKYNSVF